MLRPTHLKAKKIKQKCVEAKYFSMPGIVNPADMFTISLINLMLMDISTLKKFDFMC